MSFQIELQENTASIPASDGMFVFCLVVIPPDVISVSRYIYYLY
jgi:hypothetical protein